MFDEITNQLVLFSLAIACGGAVRLTLGLVGQKWSTTYSNTVTYLLLPSVGLVIVQLISGSIALSLGMIGALSIVRFRHPVKSPLELTIYFLLLTIGVGLSTRPELAVVLTIISIVIIFGVSVYQKFASKRPNQKSAPLLEGERPFLAEVITLGKVDFIHFKQFVIYSQHSIDVEERTTKLAFANFSDFQDFEAFIETQPQFSRIVTFNRG